MFIMDIFILPHLAYVSYPYSTRALSFFLTAPVRRAALSVYLEILHDSVN